MKVYIPFEDGSAISYDGRKFTVHKPPVGIDAYLCELSDGTAAHMWRERRGELVKALDTAWWREHKRRSESKTKRIYSREKTTE